ncbi:MAG TPA: nucleoside hydrolase [Acidimicrobiales bacterium]
MIRVIFDSDGGVDDAAALWWACTSPDVEVVAVTAVAGNVDVDQAAANLATILAAAGHPQVPVAVGPADPVGPTPPVRRASFIHGTDGLGDLGLTGGAWEPAPVGGPELLVELTAARPGELTVVATGPLSNLARALDADPGWAGRVADLVVMGGSARAGGNARPVAEANFANDPTAAARVAAGGWPRPPLLVGLDVTLRATLTDREFDLLAERRTPAAEFLAGPMAFYREMGSTFTAPGECPCHDLVAMITAAHPGVVSGPELPMAVDIGGSAAWGESVVDFRALAFARRGTTPAGVGDAADDTGATWRIGLEVDVERFRAEVRSLFGG